MTYSISRQIKKFIYATIPYTYLKYADPDSPKLEYYSFLQNVPYTHFPYSFAKEHLDAPVEISSDKDNSLPYVIHKGKKLYFPREFSTQKITNLYRSLLLEQDFRHPHHYVENTDEFQDRTLLDIGGAEGLISLEAVEKARSIYIFECDPQWKEALEATFRPWQNKVSIIGKYIGDTCGDTTLTLDRFFEDKPTDRLFLKMDIEGAECKALKGGEKLFSETSDLEFAICTYHRKNDLKNISTLLDRFSCTYIPRKGYIYYNHNLRKCLLRGRKD